MQVPSVCLLYWIWLFAHTIYSTCLDRSRVYLLPANDHSHSMLSIGNGFLRLAPKLHFIRFTCKHWIRETGYRPVSCSCGRAWTDRCWALQDELRGKSPACFHGQAPDLNFWKVLYKESVRSKLFRTRSVDQEDHMDQKPARPLHCALAGFFNWHYRSYQNSIV